MSMGLCLFDFFSGTVSCEYLKVLVNLDYTKQVCFYCFHCKLSKKIKTEKRLTLLTLSGFLATEKS